MSRTSSLSDLLTYLGEEKNRMASQEEFNKVFGAGTAGGGGSSSKGTPKYAPDGEGVAVIKDAGAGANSVGPYVYFKLYYPEYNSEEWSYNNIDPNNEIAMKILRIQFERLGILPESASPEDLGEAAKGAVGWTVKVKKQTKKPEKEGGKWFRNYYINSVVNKAETKPEAAKVDDDSIPF